MATKKKMLQAAAGNAGGTEAVGGITFDGVGNNMRLTNTQDYFTNLTVSLWFYVPENVRTYEPLLVKRFTNGYNNLEIYAFSNYRVYIRIYNNNGGRTQVMSKSLDVNNGKWNHLIFSGDTYTARTLRYYLNDTMTGTWSLSGDALGFGDQWYVARSTGSATSGVNVQGECALAHIYVSYSSIDLTVEANRRNFITADCTHPTDSDLANYGNPKIYLPLDDVDDPGLNLGSLNNFTVLSGPFGTLQVGPETPVCAATYFDGTADYLDKSSFPVTAGQKQFTFSFNRKFENNGNDGTIFFCQRPSPSNKIELKDFGFGGTSNGIYLEMSNSSGYFFIGYVYKNDKNFVDEHVDIVIDMDNQSACKCYVNGVAQTMYISTFTTGASWDYDITHAQIGVKYNNRSSFNNYEKGHIGEFYFDTDYIDIASDNPFWDADANRPKPVRQVLSETGNTPLLAMPLDFMESGLNLGTAGDFNEVSLIQGRRGATEYISRTADFDGSSSYLARTSALTGISNSKAFTCSFYYNPTQTGTDQEIINIQNSSWKYGFRIFRDGYSNKLFFGAQNSANSTILWAASSSTFTTGTYFIQASFDLTDTAKRAIYVNGSLESTTWSTYTNDTADFTSRAYPVIGARLDSGTYGRFLKGYLSEFYFATDYIDFSELANREFFADQFGYFKDLTPSIDAGDIPTPSIYMKFNDTDSFGANSGEGGDFTVNGTVIQHYDVDPR
jgi:hypothetical protein